MGGTTVAIQLTGCRAVCGFAEEVTVVVLLIRSSVVITAGSVTLTWNVAAAVSLALFTTVTVTI
jgi:hypothetical protein